MIPLSGFQSFSTIDYPGLHSCVLFTQGCPWKCRYCHNSELQEFHAEGLRHQWELFWNFLMSRRSLLDAVVFSGGEVTVHSKLMDAMRAVRNEGFKIGLHTAGIYPERLKRVLHLVDWVGFDVKAPFDERYEKVTGIRDSHKAALQSLHYLLESKKAFQLRCTVHPLLLNQADLYDLQLGLNKIQNNLTFVIQSFSKKGCIDEELLNTA
jgi:pyruvate formate lyase activating enzyme